MDFLAVIIFGWLDLCGQLSYRGCCTIGEGLGGWGVEIETSDSGGDACLPHEMINRLRMFMHLGNLTRAMYAMYCNKMLQIFRVKWS